MDVKRLTRTRGRVSFPSCLPQTSLLIASLLQQNIENMNMMMLLS